MGKKNGQFKAKLGILNVEKKFYLTLAKKKERNNFPNAGNNLNETFILNWEC